MDHLIDNFDVYIEDSFNDFYKEWTSKKYKKFSECPSYGELKTLLDSVNPLRKYIGWESLSIKQMLDWRE
ncbi:hypothetical protein HBE96_23430 [Clostridium sp. P21]|uniref:Uncharacterized protein n=1 Tax=Clostridium muellerianum TaxID=2716538 RepID=A0A7Y0EL88_9CLOT|nr:hypothetical protein [Clostridium muellerianum]NMM65533.1 hypothetical protein [Clostridium muellerianum]